MSLSKKKFYPWLVIFMSAMFLFYKYILQFSPSVMTTDLRRAFHIHATGLGNLAATYFYTYLIAQLFVGPLIDKYSVRRLTTFAILLTAAGIALFAHASSLLQAELSRALIGVGAAFGTVSYLSLATNWFSANQYAVVAGLLATAASVGAIIGKVPLAIGVHHIGWKNTLSLCALLGLLIAAIYYSVVRDKKETIYLDNKSNLKNTNTWEAIKEIFSQERLWLLTLYSGLAWAPLSVFGGLWGNPFLQEAHHVNNTQAAFMVTIAFIGLATGGPLFGFLAKKSKKRFSVMALGLVLSLFSMLYIIISPSKSLLLLNLNLFLLGLSTGAFMLGFAIGRDIFPVAVAGTVVGIINTGDALFGAFTEPLVGRFLDQHWSGHIINGIHYFSVSNYQHALILLCFYLAMALFCLAALKNSIAKKNNS